MRRDSRVVLASIRHPSHEDFLWREARRRIYSVAQELDIQSVLLGYSLNDYNVPTLTHAIKWNLAPLGSGDTQRS